MRLSIALILLIGLACKPVYQQKSITPEIIPLGDNSRTSLDWPGIYQGILPCADCSGIKTELVLNINNTYQLKTQYQGKSNEVKKREGAMFWDRTGGNITLDVIDEQYKVGENVLFKLDNEGQPIVGNLAAEYQLLKIDNQITIRNWKLIELNGKNISDDNKATLTLKNDNKVNGNSNCNNYSASFEMGPNNKLKFSGIISTKMMCQNSIEKDFFKMLDSISKYELRNNTLILSNGENEIAIFKSEFFN